MISAGLLRSKAVRLVASTAQDSLGLRTDGRDEFAFDPDSGISREEQQEIRQEIEKVATQSRISVSPEAFIVKAAKNHVNRTSPFM